jgi:ABC-type multidrug transport system ATPase subunit
MIELQNVTKRYGAKRAVDAVSFRVEAGESLALWGSNGAGKTTLLRCLLGATRFEGAITVDGLSPARNGKDARRRIGYVPQIMPVFDLKVGEMINLVARLRGDNPQQGFNRLEEFGLASTKSQSVESLSGGMKQKLALTLALLGDPPILMLDEPTANLDARSQTELISMLADLNHQGRTIVFTSHRWSEVRALADRIVILEAGKQIYGGLVSEYPGMNDTITLRVNVAPENLIPSVDLLGKHGFTAARNGASILITIESRKKAEPFLVLARSEFAVSDFDVETES